MADEVAEALDGAPTVRPDVPDDLGEAAAQAVADGADTVAAVGGDGTQLAVAEAIAGTEAALAVAPGGTVNLLGRVMGVTSVDDTVEAVRSGTIRRIDLGRCNGEPFVLNASTGYDADIISHVGDRAKRFGRLGYTAVGVARLIAPQRQRVRVTVDGGTIHDGDALGVLVLNVGHRGSTRFRLSADAEPDDGLLDVLVVASRRRAVLRAGWCVLRGRAPDARDVRVGQGRRIEVEWDAPVASQRDGDAGGSATSFVYEVEPGAVRVAVPDQP